MVLFRVAAAVYSFTDLLVAAAPVIEVTRPVAVAGLAALAWRGVVGERLRAGGAGCDEENHPDDRVAVRPAEGVKGRKRCRLRDRERPRPVAQRQKKSTNERKTRAVQTRN